MNRVKKVSEMYRDNKSEIDKIREQNRRNRAERKRRIKNARNKP